MSEKPTWTLLLIDAQPMARGTLKRQLEYYGYRVLEGESARQGLQVFQANQRQIDLVLLDLSLPDAPADKVLEVLRKLAPKVPVVLVTDQSVAEGRDRPEGVVGVLKKPVRTDRLLALVSKGVGR